MEEVGDEFFGIRRRYPGSKDMEQILAAALLDGRPHA
jgi:hypothetical protein